MLTDAEYKQSLAEYIEICNRLEVPVVYGRLKCESFKMPYYPNSLDDILAMENDGVLEPKVCIERPMRSWTRNAVNVYAASVCAVNATDASTFGDNHLNIKTTGAALVGNTSYGIGVYLDGYKQATYGNYTGEGIWVGTNAGVSSESFEDYALDTQIVHGDGAGQLRYWDMLGHLYSWDGGTRQWTITMRRHFTNHSGGSITINEIALAAGISIANTTTTYHAMMARDVLVSGVAVGDADIFKGTYTLVGTAYPS